MSTTATPRPFLVLQEAELQKSMDAGLYAVLERDGMARFRNACVSKGVDYAAATADVVQVWLLPTDPKQAPRGVYAKPLQPADVVEKGMLTDVFSYGAGRDFSITKTGAEIKAQLLGLQPLLASEATGLQATLTGLLPLIPVPPLPRTRTGLGATVDAPATLGTDSDGIPDMPRYPWCETRYREDDGRASNDDYYDSAYYTDQQHQRDRCPTSAEDAANRDRYNDLTYALRENLRDQATARRIAAVLPEGATYQLPISLVLALRFDQVAAAPVAAGGTVEK